MNVPNVNAVVAEALQRAQALGPVADPDDLEDEDRRRWNEQLLEPAAEVALFAGYDRDVLNMAWWQLNQDDRSEDLTSRHGIAAGILARASAFDPPGTRGRRAALDAEAYATRITKALKTCQPGDAGQLYLQAQACLIGYRADELVVALEALPIDVVRSDHPEERDRVAVGLVTEAMEWVHRNPSQDEPSA